MRMRWLGVTGVVLILAALLLAALGPRLWPAAYWWSGQTGMMNGGMMGGGMMDGGMMDGDVGGDPSQPFDLRFIDEMIVHHEGAVISAGMMIAGSARPELRDLAERIIAAQQDEIALMRQWREEWYPQAPDPASGMGMNGDEMLHDMSRSRADMDRMFLEMMIPHHEAAIAMAEQALDQAEHQELVTLAQNIITTQRAEIEEMQGYLRDWYSQE